MYFSAKYIDVKQHQDYAGFVINENENLLVLCDGIGEFSDSGKLAKSVVENSCKNPQNSITELVLSEEFIKLREAKLEWGTTYIAARNKKGSQTINIEYLGDGGIIHFHGDFYDNRNSDQPFRYGDIMIPHKTPQGALTKHISHNSGKYERAPTTVRTNLNYNQGNIILFYTDGIASMDGNIILKDNESRYWRYESDNVQSILEQIHFFLKENYNAPNFQENLELFNNNILNDLKNANKLDDDASLGIIITKEVLKYYSKLDD